jgi:hypothetical protein
MIQGWRSSAITNPVVVYYLVPVASENLFTGGVFPGWDSNLQYERLLIFQDLGMSLLLLVHALAMAGVYSGGGSRARNP